MYLELLFRLFKRTKKQANTLKLVIQDLNKYLIAIIARKERCLQRNIVVITNVIKSITIRDCKYIISMRVQRVEKLVVAKVEQNFLKAIKKTITNALKIAKRTTIRTTRASKRSKKRAEIKVKKEIFVAKKVVFVAKRQECKTKRIVNVAKRVVSTIAKKIIVAETKIIKSIETNKKIAYN